MLKSKDRCIPLVFLKKHLPVVSLVLLSLTWIVTGCGSLPSSFIFADATHLQYITWQAQNGGQLAGSYFANSYEQYATNATSSSSVALTGTQQNNQVDFTVSGFLGGVTLTGTIQNNTLDLTLPDSSGHLVDTTWYAATEDQYNQLLTAFSGYMQVKSALDTLNSEIQNDQSYSLASAADNAVSQEQSAMQQFQADMKTLSDCNGYYGVELDDSEADLYFDISQDAPNVSTLNQDMQQVDARWTQAKGAPLPQIQGLTLPWVVSTQTIHAEESLVQMIISAAQADYQKDQQAMNSLKQQYQQLDTQLQQFKQTHSC